VDVAAGQERVVPVEPLNSTLKSAGAFGPDAVSNDAAPIASAAIIKNLFMPVKPPKIQFPLLLIS
jgi:hypothetical protein